MPTVLVTGSNGLIASKIIQIFAENRDWKIVATSRNALRWKLPPKVRFEVMDICNPSELAYMADLYSPDVLINTAAITKPDDCEKDTAQCWEINVNGARNVADLCVRKDIYLMHFSSDFVYDGSLPTYTEEDLPQPLSAYGRSKAAADEYIAEVSTKYCIVRTSMVYGSHPCPGRGNLVSWVKDNLSAGKPIRVVCDQYRTPTLAEDLAQGCLLLAAKRETGIFHLAGPEFMPVSEIASRSADILGLDRKLISEVPTIELCEPAKRPMRTYLEIAKARQLLGYDPRNFEEGMNILKQQLGI